MKCSLLMGAVGGWIFVAVTGCGGTTDGGDALGTPAEGGTSSAGSPSSAGSNSAGSPSSGASGVQGGSAGAAPSGGTGNANSGGSSAAGAGGSVGSTPTTGLHADGGQIKNGQGQVVQIH